MKRRATGLKMALVFISLSLILGMSAALPQDMTGKMLVFPQETNTAHVRLTPSRQNLGAVTVCMRYFSDLTRPFTFFGLVTPSYNNDFHIFKMPARDEINVDVRNIVLNFKGQDYQLNRWQSVCGTWDAASGLVQLWVDGKPSSMKFATESNISGPMIIVLGQDQDSYGGSFDSGRSFVGMISDVHMWDYVLPPHHINNYRRKFTFPPGNVLNWNLIEFQIVGKVLIQEEQHL
ncbi:C-reactive protein-like [Periophthalmus magnuspinnatus]|uniref:C-reactive protein-like n=1 Tax=Periophthalmus magnuspinnatus TaxID=409849 RepID=UPI00145A990A|nr:C-reactive protein-like [Periophthalmus magnuspinnatus]